MKKLFCLIAFTFICSLNFAQAPIITTIAGTGVPDYTGDGGPATAATLNFPTKVGSDAAGNIYIADNGNNTIRKIAVNGTITTIAGNGTAGYSGDGGPATAALINSPWGIATDGANNVYFCDASNYRIRKIDAINGIITTVVGTGAGGYTGDGGLATSATMGTVVALTVDPTGNIYLADADNNVVRKVDVNTGIISTIAGTGVGGFSGDGGPAISAQFAFPVGISIDVNGNLYVSDNVNHRIRKINTSGIISTVAGTGNPGYNGDGILATSANLYNPWDAVADTNGNIFIADFFNYCIRKVDGSTGLISTYAGTHGVTGYTGDGGLATSATMNAPTACLDNNGNVIIADAYNNAIRKVSVPVSSTIMPGNTCATSYSLNTASGPDYGTINAEQGGIINTSSADGWYSVYATNNTLYIHVKFSNDSSAWQIKKMTVAVGTCSSFTISGSDSLSSVNDTSLDVVVYNVTPGELFYIKLAKGTLYNCGNCKENDKVSYVLAYQSFQYCVPSISTPVNGCTGCSGNNSNCQMIVCQNSPITICLISCDAVDFCFAYLNVPPSFVGGGTPGYCSPSSGTATCYSFIPTLPGTFTVNATGIFGTPSDCDNGMGTAFNSFLTFTFVVIAPPAPPVLSLNLNNVCAGQPVCFTQSNFPGGAYTYTLATGGGGNFTGSNSNPIANPLCTGYPSPGNFTSTLTVQNANGCKASTTAGPVSVNSIQASISYTVNCSVINLLANNISCVGSGASYSWTILSGTTVIQSGIAGQNASVGLTPNTTYTVQLTVTNQWGATASFTTTATMGAQDCCPVSSCSDCTGQIVNVSSNSLYTISALSPATNTTFKVGDNGIIYIYSPTNNGVPYNTTFNSCKFIMGKGSKIIISTRKTSTFTSNNNSTLNITFNNCHLYGCVEMWDGISFEYQSNISFPYNNHNFTTNLAFTNTLFEDAWMGVDNTNAFPTSSLGHNSPKITVYNSIFNKNYIDLNLDQSKLQPGSYSQKSFYTCRNISFPLPVSFSGNPANYYSTYLQNKTPLNTKPSSNHGGYTGQPTGGYGVILFHSLGSSASTQFIDFSSSSNVIDRHLYGIFGININLVIGKQYFYNLPFIGILSNGYNGSGGPPNLSLGTSNSSANNFFLCGTGIYTAFKTQTLTASYNNFRGVDVGIKVETFNTPSGSINCDVSHNNIKNVRLKGIWFNLNAAINANVASNLVYYSAPSQRNFTSTGIVVNEFSSTSSQNALYNIDQNNIGYTFIGIDVHGTNKTQITSNTIQVNSPSPFLRLPGQYNFGINTTNCYNNSIGNNSITGDYNPLNYGEYGIVSADHPMQNIYCNQINGFNTGFNLQAPSLTPTGPDLPIRNNDLNKCLIDVWMLNNCVLGPQRITSGSSFLPIDNTFNHTGSTASTYTSSYCSGGNPFQTDGSQSPFYVKFPPLFNMTKNSSDISTSPISIPMTPQIVTGTSPTNCNTPGGNAHRLMNLAHKVAVDSLIPVNQKRNRFVSRSSLFNNLITENINTSSDPALSNFISIESNSNIGKLFNVEQTINNSLLQNNSALLFAAQQQNNSLVAADSIQLLHQQINSVYIDYLGNGYAFSIGNLVSLRGIAPLCPFIYGTAVWQARSLLAGIDSVPYQNACEILEFPSTSGQRLVYEEKESPIETLSASVFPNPNNGTFTVKVFGKFKKVNIEVYNTLGALVLTKETESTENIQIEGLSQGFYTIKINTDGLFLKTERVVISK